MQEKKVCPFHGSFARLNFKVLLYCAEEFELYALYSRELIFLKKKNGTKNLKKRKRTNLLFAKIFI